MCGGVLGDLRWMQVFGYRKKHVVQHRRQRGCMASYDTGKVRVVEMCDSNCCSPPFSTTETWVTAAVCTAEKGEQRLILKGQRKYHSNTQAARQWHKKISEKKSFIQSTKIPKNT